MLLQLRVSLETDALQKHIQASLCLILYPARQYDNFNNIYPVIVNRGILLSPSQNHNFQFNNLSILTVILGQYI